VARIDNISRFFPKYLYKRKLWGKEEKESEEET